MDEEIKVSLEDNETLHLTLGEGKEIIQELYVTEGKLGITHGNEIEELPYDLDPTDFLAMYSLKRGGI
ncbi:hypothetical protein [Veillonella sp.]|uniref:hypothetical protein n=1 Tax=Veillonella sp. TaxID=1926307 RepID=UPI0025D1B2B1|nr:hypothetical protein [Veillonella sp.]